MGFRGCGQSGLGQALTVELVAWDVKGTGGLSLGGSRAGPRAKAGPVNAAALGSWRGRGDMEWREGYRKGLCEPI